VEDKKETSKILMTMVNSSGCILNGALQPQNYYVSIDIKDPNHELVARVHLTFEQVTRMLMYNGEVECTLSRYRGADGKIASEIVIPLKSINQKLEDNIKEIQTQFNDRLNDLHKDVFELINGDAKPNKSKLKDLLHQITILQSHYANNESFMLQEAETELQQATTNATNQLGIFIQSKIGTDKEVPLDLLKQMLPVNNNTLQLENKVEPVLDDYTTKIRVPKPIVEMTELELSIEINKELKRIENDKSITSNLFGSLCKIRNYEIYICYVSHQGTSIVNREKAIKYLQYLKTITSNENNFKTHYNFI
jgi:hypothetical protein